MRPDRLDLADIGAIPVTLKRDLVERPDDFQCADVARYLATRTTGTTGRPADPAAVWSPRVRDVFAEVMGSSQGPQHLRGAQGLCEEDRPVCGARSVPPHDTRHEVGLRCQARSR